MTHQKDAVALVFAGSRGIGRATAEKLAATGYKVAVNYQKNRAAAEAVVQSIGMLEGHAIALQGDVARQAEVKRVFDETERNLGPVSVVVNAAGASTFAPLAHTPDEEIEKLIAVNARGAIFVLQEAARRIEDNGRIIHLSTAGTAMPIAMAGAYLATKAAGELAALCLAKELGGRGVTVNVVSPGVTRTDGLVMPQEALDSLIAQTPLGRLGVPGDVADVVAFLASPDARWMTGQNVRPTGGLL